MRWRLFPWIAFDANRTKALTELKPIDAYTTKALTYRTKAPEVGVPRTQKGFLEEAQRILLRLVNKFFW